MGNCYCRQIYFWVIFFFSHAKNTSNLTRVRNSLGGESLPVIQGNYCMKWINDHLIQVAFAIILAFTRVVSSLFLPFPVPFAAFSLVIFFPFIFFWIYFLFCFPTDWREWECRVAVSILLSFPGSCVLGGVFGLVQFAALFPSFLPFSWLSGIGKRRKSCLRGFIALLPSLFPCFSRFPSFFSLFWRFPSFTTSLFFCLSKILCLYFFQLLSILFLLILFRLVGSGYLVTEYQLTHVQAGDLISLPFLTAAFLAPFFSFFIDKTGFILFWRLSFFSSERFFFAYFILKFTCNFLKPKTLSHFFLFTLLNMDKLCSVTWMFITWSSTGYFIS